MMNIRTILLVIVTLMILGVGATMAVAQGNSDGSSDGTVMQETGDEEAGGDEEGGTEEPAVDESAVEEEPAVEGMDVPPMSSDVIADLTAGSGEDQNILDALAGIRDYEVSYKTDLSREELTPPELRALDNTIYAGDESIHAQRTALLNDLNLLIVLEDRYEKVEEEFGATVDQDFDDENSRTLNYYQPRGDAFVITDLIPDELRPEMDGTGLDGAVDPNLLEELFWANYQAQLRLVPIYIVGTMEAGPNKICMFVLFGRSYTIQEGQSRNFGYFSLTCVQISEDYVVFILRAGNANVTRTFHTRR